jgi:hypothetical protein
MGRNSVAESFILKKCHNRGVLKVPASCTSALQPFDICVAFRSSKCCTSHLEEKDLENDVPYAILDKGLTDHGMKGVTKKKIILGVLKVSYALRTVLANAKILKDGFVRSGMCPHCPEKIYHQCKTALDAEILVMIDGARTPFVQSFLRSGQLLENDMSMANIPYPSPPLRRQLRKDQKALIHQRFVWMNHPQTISRYNAAQQTRNVSKQRKQQEEVPLSEDDDPDDSDYLGGSEDSEDEEEGDSDGDYEPEGEIENDEGSGGSNSSSSSSSSSSAGEEGSKRRTAASSQRSDAAVRPQTRAEIAYSMKKIYLFE